MAPRLRIGLFPYLNVQPLVYGLRDDAAFEMVIDLPSRIADLFRDGQLDLAMVPSLEAATLGAPVFDTVGIASDGGVETVMLHHRVPLSEVSSLAADEASRTSAALSRILIAQASGRLPDCRPFSVAGGAAPDADAVLVIGDPAFTFAMEGFARIDLGAEWKRQYSLPFVFALMVAGPRALSRGMPERLRQAVERGLEAAATIAASYNGGVDAPRAERYLRRVIRYGLQAREREGLALFYRLAREAGLLAEEKELRFDAI